MPGDCRNPKAVGDRTEGIVLSELVRLGKHVLISPFTENVRYDLVVEEHGCFVPVQVKTGRLNCYGAVQFHSCSVRRGGLGGRRPYRGECELFAVYCPETDQVYYVPVTECGSTETVLRIRTPRNGQLKGVRWARDYESFPSLSRLGLASPPPRIASHTSLRTPRESSRPGLNR